MYHRINIFLDMPARVRQSKTHKNNYTHTSTIGEQKELIATGLFWKQLTHLMPPYHFLQTRQTFS